MRMQSSEMTAETLRPRRTGAAAGAGGGGAGSRSGLSCRDDGGCGACCSIVRIVIWIVGVVSRVGPRRGRNYSRGCSSSSSVGLELRVLFLERRQLFFNGKAGGGGRRSGRYRHGLSLLDGKCDRRTGIQISKLRLRNCKRVCACVAACSVARSGTKFGFERF